MSRTLIGSNTLRLWLSLSVAVAASALSVGCSSSSDSGGASAGKGGDGTAAHAGSESGNSEAGESAVGGQTSEPSEEGGRQDTPAPGGGGSSGSLAGASNGGDAGSPGAPGAPGGAAGAEDPGDPGDPGAAGAPDVGNDELAAAQARALVLIDSLGKLRKCTTCHDIDYKGAGFYPNITPDVDTGIGSWDDEDIKLAIREGKDKAGETLCATMERYPFTDAQVADLVVYLKHLKPITKKITKKCTTP
jgi:hypothetical protein